MFSSFVYKYQSVYGIRLTLARSDPIKRHPLYLFIWDLVILGQFDHSIHKITLSVITLSGLHCINIQWKPLNVITLGQMESDNINQMITITNCLLIQKSCLLFIWDLVSMGQFDHSIHKITLSVITLSGLHCVSTYLCRRPRNNLKLIILNNW
jgi:hypothetical protein